MSVKELKPDVADLRAELGRRTGLTHIAAQAPLLPLTELDPRHFEILIYYLLCEEAGSESSFDSVTLLNAGADKARDILLRRGAVTGIVQCKRRSRRMGQKDIATEILRFALYAVRDRALLPQPDTQYQFWTASGLTEEARQLVEGSDTEAVLRTLFPDLFGAARSNHVTLRSLSDDVANDVEEREAIEIAARLHLKHVGPEAIARKLHQHPSIRRQFFRSPEDGPPPASNAEVDRLVASLRDNDLARLHADGRLDSQPYVPRAGLDAAFADYLEAPARLFSAIGGSGQGKTSWVAQLLKTDATGRSMVMIPAEKITAQDRNPVDTLGRLLTAQRMDGITPERFDQALWAWLDAGNRLLAIDGLDRVISSARETLPTWLDAAVELTASASVRLVLTARREAWDHLRTQVPGLCQRAFTPEGSTNFASFELAALESGEAEKVYAAYGVATSQHRGARLHSPALIALFAKMRGFDGDIITRYDILAREHQNLLSELKAWGVGPVSAIQVLDWLGEQLIVASDGWIAAAAPSHLIAALDVLVERDRLIQRESGFRLDADDMAEFLLARRLNIDTANQALDAGRNDPLFIGAVSLLLARCEYEGRADAALGELLDGAGPGRSTRLETVAHALLELRDPAAVENRVRQAIGLWKDDNLYLMASNLGRMLVEIALPGLARFKLILPLIDGEDRDDWRGNRADRLTSNWAEAAERAVREDPVGLLPQVIELAGKQDALRKAVGELLLFRAAQFEPEAALRESWALREKAPGAFLVAMHAAPLEAAKFLPQIDLTTIHVTNFVVERLLQIASKEHEDISDEAGLLDALGAAASSLIERVTAPHLRATLRVIQLGGGDHSEARSELDRLWPALPSEVFWKAVIVLGDDGLSRVDELLRQDPPTRERQWLLSTMPASVFDSVAPEPLLETLRWLIVHAPDHVAVAANVLEIMLYRFSAPAFAALEDLAFEVAKSPIDQARSKLIYYAGSRIHDEPAPHDTEIERRERLLSVLVASETGGTLDQLVWKLVESADERPKPLAHLLNLTAQFGEDRVLAALDRHSFLPGAATLRNAFNGPRSLGRL